MARQPLNRTTRREPLGVGKDVNSQPGAAKIVGITRDAEGRVVVLLDHGEGKSPRVV